MNVSVVVKSSQLKKKKRKNNNPVQIIPHHHWLAQSPLFSYQQITFLSKTAAYTPLLEHDVYDTAAAIPPALGKNASTHCYGEGCYSRGRKLTLVGGYVCARCFSPCVRTGKKSMISRGLARTIDAVRL